MVLPKIHFANNVNGHLVLHALDLVNSWMEFLS